jgi:hypothetical protein
MLIAAHSRHTPRAICPKSPTGSRAAPQNAAMRNRSICLGLVSYIIRFIQNAVNLRSA